jgi:putative glutamine amidotransferase
VINVALGGTLYQDIKTQCPDKGEHRVERSTSTTSTTCASFPARGFAALPGEGPKHCNSIHHQAIKTLARPRRRGDERADGLIEAVRWEGHCFVVGVQWHPEFMDPAIRSSSRASRSSTRSSSVRAAQEDR